MNIPHEQRHGILNNVLANQIQQLRERPSGVGAGKGGLVQHAKTQQHDTPGV